MTPLLSLQGITYAYPTSSRTILDDLHLDLNPQERIGLSGPNGCGKSTLLHIITGLIIPHVGTVTLEDLALTSEPAFARARPRMGYLLQRTEDQLFCPTVLEDVAFGPLNLGLSSAEAEITAKETLEELGIAHLAHCPGCNLSGGEQKLAALASVLSMRPKLLLLDEPTNDLDPQSLDLLVSVLDRQNLPFIAVSHDAAFLAKVCTTLTRLEHGKPVTQ